MQSVKKGANEAAETVKKTDKPLKQQAMNFTEIFSATQLAAQGLQVLKKGYDFAKEGARLEFTIGKFDRLAATIGTTGDALRGNLLAATKGTLSEMDAMAMASDLLSLGLTKNEKDTVRLASVVSGLGMDMNQLVLTLANQTTMRFDQLGVAVVGFDDRVKALKATGMDANAAFTEAFLQQAEAQLLKVGNAADTDAGEFMKLEASWEDFMNSLKMGTAQFLMPTIETLRDASDANRQLENATKALNATQKSGSVIMATSAEQAKKLKEAHEAQVNSVNSATQSYTAWAQAAGMAVRETDGAVESAKDLNTEMDILAQYMTDDLSSAQEDYNSKIAEYKTLLDEAKTAEERGEIEAKIAAETAAYNERAKAIMFNIQQSALLAAAESGNLSGDQIAQLPGILNELAGSYGLIDESQKQAIDSTNALISQWQEGAISEEALTQALRNNTQYTQENTATVLDAGAKSEIMFKRLAGRSEDARQEFIDMKQSQAELADALRKDAVPAVGALNVALANIKDQQVYVDIFFREHGGSGATFTAPAVGGGAGYQTGIHLEGAGRAAGGPLAKGGYTIVGDAPGGGWTPFTEVITPSGYVLDANTARKMKDAGMLDGAMAMAGGGSLGGRSPITGSGRAGSGSTGGRSPKTNPGTRPRSSGEGGSISPTVADGAFADGPGPMAVTPNAEAAMISALQSGQQQATIATNQGNQVLQEISNTLKKLLGKTPDVQDMVRANNNFASKFS